MEEEKQDDDDEEEYAVRCVCFKRVSRSWKVLTFLYCTFEGPQTEEF